MKCRNENNLVLIENGQIVSYTLDDRTEWEIGRPSKDNVPDIKLHTATVSRKHGRFKNIMGFWYYTDYCGKNGTFLNHQHLGKGLGGKLRAIDLNDGDTFVFGSNQEEVINCKTVLGVFLTTSYEDGWRTIDTKGCELLRFESGGCETQLLNPLKGSVIRKDKGIAIYMGERTYTSGDMQVTGR